MKSMDIGQHTVLSVCMALAFVVTCVISVMAYTVFTRRQGRREGDGFVSNPVEWPSPDKLLNNRGESFAVAGLAQCYTSTYDTTNRPMFLSPSANDAAQALGMALSATTPFPDTLRDIACDDTAFPACTCTTTLAAASRNATASACKVRVFDAMYSIIRMCMRMTTVDLPAGQSTGTDSMILALDPTLPSTCLFVLLRPLFASTPGSNLFKVNLYAKAGAAPGNTLMDFDSSRNGTPLQVSLTRVTDPTVAAQVGIGSDRAVCDAKQGSTYELLSVRCTGERPPIRDTDANVGRVLTMFIAIPVGLTSQDQLQLLELSGSSAQLQCILSADGLTLSLSFAGTQILDAIDVELSVDPGSLVVVTLCTDTLVMASMSPSRVTVRSMVMPFNYTKDMYGTSKEIAAALLAANSTTPSGLAPYTNTTIPDLADIAVRSRMFPVRAF